KAILADERDLAPDPGPAARLDAELRDGVRPRGPLRHHHADGAVPERGDGGRCRARGGAGDRAGARGVAAMGGPVTLTQALDAAAERADAGYSHLVQEKEPLKFVAYAEIARRARRFGAALQAAGVRAG